MASLAAPVPIAAIHDAHDFDCGVAELDLWLQHRALKNESKFSRTYVACDGTAVAGYYCISAGSVARAAAPGRLRRNAPDEIPVAVLGRLAVCRRYSGQNLGRGLLYDALARVVFASKTIGIGAVLIHAYDDAARSFYRACAEFIEFPADSRSLYLPTESIEAALVPNG